MSKELLSRIGRTELQRLIMPAEATLGMFENGQSMGWFGEEEMR